MAASKPTSLKKTATRFYLPVFPNNPNLPLGFSDTYNPEPQKNFWKPVPFSPAMLPDFFLVQQTY
jgi:hypothetical protein